MSTEHAITVRGIKVQVVRKTIKNLHLGVYPPNGRVRVAAPMAVSLQAVRLAVIGKLGWVNRQRRKFLGQARQSKREMVSGESHFFLGRRYRLRVVEFEGNAVQHVAKRPSAIELHVRTGAPTGRREAVLEEWYREQLRDVAIALMNKWQKKLGVEVSSWGIKRMRTKWGACNPTARRVWLNLDLVRCPPACIEYVVVHELVHLLVHRHERRFFELMSCHLPDWQFRRELLGSVPLSFVDWSG